VLITRGLNTKYISAFTDDERATDTKWRQKFIRPFGSGELNLRTGKQIFVAAHLAMFCN
jgi:hypothetical protein